MPATGPSSLSPWIDSHRRRSERRATAATNAAATGGATSDDPGQLISMARGTPNATITADAPATPSQGPACPTARARRCLRFDPTAQWTKPSSARWRSRCRHRPIWSRRATRQKRTASPAATCRRASTCDACSTSGPRLDRSHSKPHGPAGRGDSASHVSASTEVASAELDEAPARDHARTRPAIITATRAASTTQSRPPSARSDAPSLKGSRRLTPASAAPAAFRCD